MTQYLRPRDRNAFEIAILCALPIESDPMIALFDEQWEIEHSYGRAPGDPNSYTTGRLGDHNVVLVHLPGMGKAHAASAAATIRSSFRNIKLGLLVGICGGVPSRGAGQGEILLGDVVISTGIVQYDFGRQFSNQVVRKNTLLDQLGRPSQEIRALLNKLTGAMGRHQLQSSMTAHLSKLLQHRLDHISYPGIEEDKLFEPTYTHKHHAITDCSVCSPQNGSDEVVCDAALELSCTDLCCDDTYLVHRGNVKRARQNSSAQSSQLAIASDRVQPIIHLGLVASGDLVMKTALRRDLIAQTEKVIAFEMEGVGVWDQFPTIIIKGVCDYADSHKNKRWQKYAASTAAACTKAFLKEWRVEDVPLESEHSTYDGQENSMTAAVFSRRSTSQTLLPSRTDYDRVSPGHSPIPPLHEEYRKARLESLWFKQIDARQVNIRNALARTCTWLLSTPEYRTWLDHGYKSDAHGFLWIKGKPAAGKSTIMKFALKNAERSMATNIIVSFFFNARGEDLEKSIIGMYRSLLFQLMQKEPELQSLLDHDQSLPIWETAEGDIIEWDIDRLKDLISKSVTNLKDRCLVCFIDALDECDEDQVRDMVRFFQYLGHATMAVPSGCRLLICFSSRHYPNISIDESIQLVLEKQEEHQQDIAKYINSELKAGRSQLVEQIKIEILDRASGIFLWVVLVIQILNKEYDRGRIHALRKKLKEIPDGLDRLFDSVLTRDGEDLQELIACIRWIFCARQPLRCEELYHAVLTMTEPEAVTAWYIDDISLKDMERFILNASKGLAEVTKGRNPRVQFIHESVRDFLLKENGLDRLEQNLSKQFEGTSHDRLKKCCETYMMYIATGPNPPTEPDDFPLLEYAVMNVLWHADVAQGQGFPQTDFLAQFALSSWIPKRNSFKHKGRAYTKHASWLYVLTCEKLLNLIPDELRQIEHMDILGEHFNYPLFAALFYKDEAVLATLLRPMVSPADGLGPSNQTLLDLTEADQHGVIQKLLHDSGGKKFSKYRTLLSYAAENGDVELMKVMLRTGKVAVSLGDSEGRTPLFWAALTGHHTAVELLLSTGESDVNLGHRHRHGSPLIAAADGGFEDVVRLLLKQDDLDPNSMDSKGRTALYIAALRGRKNLVNLLLSDKRIFPDLHSESNIPTPLWAATLCGHKEIVKILLGCDKVNPTNRNDSGESLFSAIFKMFLSWKMPESKACVTKHPLEEVEGQATLREHPIKRLRMQEADEDVLSLESTTPPEQDLALELASQADMEAHSPAETRILTRFSSNSPENRPSYVAHANGAMTLLVQKQLDIAKLLLNTGRIDPNAQNDQGRTALHHAAAAGNMEAVTFLLAINQIDSDPEDFAGETPLHKAVESGALQVVEMLLGRDGVRIDKSTNSGHTPLYKAALHGNIAVMSLLLTHGAMPNVSSNDGVTAIAAAASNNHSAAVKMLLDTGRIDPDEVNETGQAVLHRAVIAGSEQTVEILLTSGRADPNVKDEHGLTPLLLAAALGNVAIVKLLIGIGKVNPDVMEYDHGRTPLWAAAATDSQHIVELLSTHSSFDLYKTDRETITSRRIKQVIEGKTFHTALTQETSGVATYKKLLLTGKWRSSERLEEERLQESAQPTHRTERQHLEDAQIKAIEKFVASSLYQPIRHQVPDFRGGIHALQDYQMQLKLLEQQNKKRLMLEKQLELINSS